MEETIFLKDEQVKVTNLRVTCNHVTIPIDKVDHVNVNLKVNSLVAAFVCFLLSFVIFYWYTIGACVIIGCILACATFFWVLKVYKTYVQLAVTVGQKNVVLMETGLSNRDYIYKIEDALNDSLLKEVEKNKELGKSGVTGLDMSETMKLKLMLKDYEDSKIIKPDNKDKSSAEGDEKSEESAEDKKEDSTDKEEKKTESADDKKEDSTDKEEKSDAPDDKKDIDSEKEK